MIDEKTIIINKDLHFIVTESMKEIDKFKISLPELYNNVFSDYENNRIAGLPPFYDVKELKHAINLWFNDTTKFMFFLYKGNSIIGNLQAFTPYIQQMSPDIIDNGIEVGYMIAPSEHGKGYGTLFLEAVTSYLVQEGYTPVLGFRDGNYASEKIALKNNYKFLKRITKPDIDNRNKPMTYMVYGGEKRNLKQSLNEDAYSNQTIIINETDEIKHRVRRIGPSLMNYDEYIYLSSSLDKPTELNETYYIISPVHRNIVNDLKRLDKFVLHYAMNDKSSKIIYEECLRKEVRQWTAGNL